jgi:integrase
MSCADARVRNYRYRMQYFVQWCEEEGIDNMNELTGRNIQRWRMWRHDSKDLEKTTLRNHMCSLRVLLKWCGSIEAVPENLYDKIMLSNVGHGERHWEEMMDAGETQKLLDYLSKYHLASIEHVAIALLWETGVRIGAAESIDIGDIDFEEEVIWLKHRPDEDTPLKNGKGGERPVAITSELADLLEEHIENRRNDVTDEYGRKPLLTTRVGRMHPNTLRMLVYDVTAPHFQDDECPDCEEGEERKCEESLNPHAIRRGSITHFLSQDVPVDIVDDRMNVSRDVLDEHYDERSAEVKLEQRRGYLDEV